MENTLWPHNYFCMTLCHTHCGSATETGTLRCLQKEMATYRHWSASLWRNPDNYFCMTLCHTHCGSATETGTLRCLQKEMATYRHWSASLWRNPDNVSHCRILSPDNTEWRLISATICGWRQRFVADQLWLRKRIREEEEATKRVPVNSYLSINPKVHLDNSKGKRHQSTQ